MRLQSADECHSLNKLSGVIDWIELSFYDYFHEEAGIKLEDEDLRM